MNILSSTPPRQPTSQSRSVNLYLYNPSWSYWRRIKNRPATLSWSTVTGKMQLSSQDNSGRTFIIFDVPFSQIQKASFVLGQPRFTINGQFCGLVMHESNVVGADRIGGAKQMGQDQEAAEAAGIGELHQILIDNNVPIGSVKVPIAFIGRNIVSILIVFAIMFLIIMFISQ